jgi:hypothetical protein
MAELMHRAVEIPSHWTRIRSGDWGSASPFAFHWPWFRTRFRIMAPVVV